MIRLLTLVLALTSYQSVLASENCNLSELQNMLWRMPLDKNPNTTNSENRYFAEYRYHVQDQVMTSGCHLGGELDVNISRDGSKVKITSSCDWGYISVLQNPELLMVATPENEVYHLVYNNEIVGKFDLGSQLVWNLKDDKGFTVSGLINFSCKHRTRRLKGDFQLSYIRENDFINFSGQMSKNLSK